MHGHIQNVFITRQPSKDPLHRTETYTNKKGTNIKEKHQYAKGWGGQGKICTIETTSKRSDRLHASRVAPWRNPSVESRLVGNAEGLCCGSRASWVMYAARVSWRVQHSSSVRFHWGNYQPSGIHFVIGASRSPRTSMHMVRISPSPSWLQPYLLLWCRLCSLPELAHGQRQSSSLFRPQILCRILDLRKQLFETMGAAISATNKIATLAKSVVEWRRMM